MKEVNMKRSGKVIKLLIIAGGIGGALLLFLLLGPPKLLAKSSTPDFCAGCHVMQANYEAWIHAGAHRRSKCVDCHLPHHNIGVYYVWKSIDGFKDALIFYSGKVPEQIRLTSHGQKVLQDNCIRCHQSTVELMNHERKCWSCHRRIAHKQSGAIETL